MGSGIGSVGVDGLVKATAELMEAAVPGGFAISTKTFPLSEVERVWGAGDGMPRAVFQVS